MMADGLKITVKREQLIRKFQKLVPNARVELVAAAMKGAEEVAGLAKRFARSHRVRASIHAEPLPQRLAALVAAGDASTLVPARKGSGEMVSLARLEEFGVPPHTVGGKFKGAHHPGVKPHPFLFPAARLLKKQNKARMARALGAAARKAAAGK
jgi:hypothetical protein